MPLISACWPGCWTMSSSSNCTFDLSCYVTYVTMLRDVTGYFLGYLMGYYPIILLFLWLLWSLFILLNLHCYSFKLPICVQYVLLTILILAMAACWMCITVEIGKLLKYYDIQEKSPWYILLNFYRIHYCF